MWILSGDCFVFLLFHDTQLFTLAVPYHRSDSKIPEAEICKQESDFITPTADTSVCKVWVYSHCVKVFVGGVLRW